MGIFKTLHESAHPLEESVKKIGEYENDEKTHRTTIHKDSDTGEYKVKLHVNGKHHEPADYFTDDKQDAHDTAKVMIKPKPLKERASYHKLSSGKDEQVQIEGDHQHEAKRLNDGESTTRKDNLITHYKGGKGETHFATSHREGDKVHFRDAYTKAHIATVDHKDL